MTLHPSGITHGPHPSALKRMYEQPNESTNEYAVMIDSKEQLELTSSAETGNIELESYATSWHSQN